MAKRETPSKKPNGLLEVEVTPEQAKFLVDLNQQAKAAAEAAQQRFLVAASAVLAGKVPEGSDIRNIDLARAVVIVHPATKPRLVQ